MPYFRGMAAALVLTLGAACVASAVWKPSPLPEAAALDSRWVPKSVAGYVSVGDQTLPPEILRVLPGAGITARRYVHDGSTLDFLLISGAHGVALHDPRLCLGNWLLSAPTTETLPGTPVTMQVYQASTEPNAPPSLQVSYFYVAGNRIISNPSQIRASLLWGDLLGRENAPVFFFRFVQPLGHTPEENQRIDAGLQTFAAQMWRVMRPKVEAALHERIQS
ncbi:MAG: exosortase-associated EpsI family protein [Janthinobacterium lividum]